VFLVDRDELSRIAIENNLRKKSFDMVSTRSINDAVRYVRESNEIGLLLVGLESTTVGDVYAAVKEILGIADVPVLFMVKHSDSNLIDLVKDIPSYGYVIKDIGLPAFIDSIQTAMRLHSASIDTAVETKALRVQNARTNSMLNLVEDGILELNKYGLITGMNASAVKILENTADQLVGKDSAAVFVFDCTECSNDFRYYLSRLWETRADQYFPDETVLELANGQKKQIRGFISIPDNDDNSGNEALVVFRDVKVISTLRSVLKHTFSEMHTLVSELHKSLYLDSLTDLPNRVSLYEHINKKLAEGKSENRIALVFVDIDNFRNITKTFGHIASDGIIADIGKKTAVFRVGEGAENSFAARLSSDEFVVVFENYENNDSLLKQVISLSEFLSTGYEIDGVSFDITVSMGISRYPDDGRTISDLMRKADIALSKAKESGKKSIKMFNSDYDKKLRWNLSVEKLLRHSIENNELSMRYQPQCSLATKQVDGYECLLRWNSPVLGMVSPGEFIRIAEKTGLIIHIGEWVLNEAFAFLKEIHNRDNRVVNVSVNVSVVQLMQKGFDERVIRILDDARVPAEHITLEITESVFIRSFNEVIPCITRLKERGFRLSIDDFGTGYSSLSYLRKLPFDELKIDRSFISDIDTNEKTGRVLNSLVSLAHNHDLEVVVEGIETDQQMKVVERSECNRVQGYLTGRPISRDEAIDLFCGNAMACT